MSDLINAIVSLDYKLPFRLKKRSTYVVASCPILDIVTQGDDEEEAKANLIEATRLFLITCIERGTIDEVLKQCGFDASCVNKKMTLKKNQYISVSVPYLTAHNQKKCHA